MDYPVSYLLVSANHAWGRKNKTQSSERIALKSYFQDVLRLAADGEMAQTISAIEDQVILAQAIADLPDSERNAVLSHGLMDLSFADAADYLGVSKSTVQTTFNRGIRKLRQRLAPRSLCRGVESIVTTPESSSSKGGPGAEKGDETGLPFRRISSNGLTDDGIDLDALRRTLDPEHPDPERADGNV